MTTTGNPALDALLDGAARSLQAALRDADIRVNPSQARDLVADLNRRGLLAVGTITTYTGHGVLTEDGNVQRVAPGDDAFDDARPWTRRTIETPWALEDDR